MLLLFGSLLGGVALELEVRKCFGFRIGYCAYELTTILIGGVGVVGVVVLVLLLGGVVLYRHASLVL